MKFRNKIPKKFFGLFCGKVYDTNLNGIKVKLLDQDIYRKRYKDCLGFECIYSDASGVFLVEIVENPNQDLVYLVGRKLWIDYFWFVK